MEQMKSTSFVASPELTTFLQGNLVPMGSLLKMHGCCFAAFPGREVEVAHPDNVSAEFIRGLLLQSYSNVEFQRALELRELESESEMTKMLPLTGAQYLIVSHYQEWISTLTKLDALVLNYDKSICLFGSSEGIENGLLLINEVLTNYSLGLLPPLEQEKVLRLPSPFAEGHSQEGDIDSFGQLYLENVNNAAEQGSDFTPFYLQDPPKTRKEPSLPYAVDVTTRFPAAQNDLDNNSSPLSPLSILESGSFNRTPDGKLKMMTLSMVPKHMTFMVKSTDAPRLIGSRGANKKKLEQLTGCRLMLHTENRTHGCFPIEISGPSDEICEEAKQKIMSYLDTDSNAPLHDSPSKAFVPSKIMLQLSPSKPTD